MHRKIVFVKVESSVHWSRRYYFYKRLKLKFYWDLKEQSTKRYPVYTRYPKKLVQYGRVRIEIKHLYLCFIAEINYKYSWFNSYAPYKIYKIRIQMFYLFIQTFKLLPSYLEYTCYFSINRNNSLFLFPFSMISPTIQHFFSLITILLISIKQCTHYTPYFYTRRSGGCTTTHFRILTYNYFHTNG